jgi:N-acetylmuramoyl-L-alanine amidase
MKVAIDPGHGMGNRKAGVYDPGKPHTVGTATYQEADIVLGYANDLCTLLGNAGIDVFMTRTSNTDSAPLLQRADSAAAANCTHYLSLHLNSPSKAGDTTTNGVETYYCDSVKDLPFARKLHQAVAEATCFTDRGVKERDLAVLHFAPGPVTLIELGFITNDADRTFLLDASNRNAVCTALFNALISP